MNFLKKEDYHYMTRQILKGAKHNLQKDKYNNYSFKSNLLAKQQIRHS
jgi:hypothetical protein